jgi:uncharacterized membrane protein
LFRHLFEQPRRQRRPNPPGICPGHSLPDCSETYCTAGPVEIAAAIAPWITRIARLTAPYLVGYLVATLPAHLHAVLSGMPMSGLRDPWLWIRIPFQVVVIAWDWRASRYEG